VLGQLGGGIDGFGPGSVLRAGGRIRSPKNLIVDTHQERYSQPRKGLDSSRLKVKDGGLTKGCSWPGAAIQGPSSFDDVCPIKYRLIQAPRLAVSSFPSYNTPPYEVPMPFSIRLSRRFPVYSAVRYNASSLLKLPWAVPEIE
jgi:hypothetical protein